MPNRDDRALVRNAADRQQVARAKRVEEIRDNQFIASLQVVLATAEGRLVLAHLIRDAGVFHSIWDQSAKIHYNAGRQDYGHYLMAKCIEADEAGYELMEREARERQRVEERGTAAVQQSSRGEPQ